MGLKGSLETLLCNIQHDWKHLQVKKTVWFIFKKKIITIPLVAELRALHFRCDLKMVQ